jgi:hypothetical protein
MKQIGRLVNWQNNSISHSRNTFHGLMIELTFYFVKRQNTKIAEERSTDENPSVAIERL